MTRANLATTTIGSESITSWIARPTRTRDASRGDPKRRLARGGLRKATAYIDCGEPLDGLVQLTHPLQLL